MLIYVAANNLGFVWMSQDATSFTLAGFKLPVNGRPGRPGQPGDRSTGRRGTPGNLTWNCLGSHKPLRWLSHLSGCLNIYTHNYARLPYMPSYLGLLSWPQVSRVSKASVVWPDIWLWKCILWRLPRPSGGGRFVMFQASSMLTFVAELTWDFILRCTMLFRHTV